MPCIWKWRKHWIVHHLPGAKNVNLQVRVVTLSNVPFHWLVDRFYKTPQQFSDFVKIGEKIEPSVTHQGSLNPHSSDTTANWVAFLITSPFRNDSWYFNTKAPKYQYIWDVCKSISVFGYWGITQVQQKKDRWCECQTIRLQEHHLYSVPVRWVSVKEKLLHQVLADYVFLEAS